MSKYKQLLVHPKPSQGESMFSYMLRLSNENQTPLLQLLNMLRQGTRHVQAEHFGLFDLFPDTWISLVDLSTLCGSPVERLEECTLLPLYRRFTDNENVNRARFMSRLIRDELVYCPQCLQERNVFPLLWRFNHVQVCLTHHRYLEPECLYCHKAILLSDVSCIGECPYCQGALTSTRRVVVPVPDGVIEQQSWVAKRFTELLEGAGPQFMGPERLAIKILYVLNECNSTFRRQFVQGRLREANILPTLLQHARGSLSQNRMLHFQFIMDVLFDCQMTFPYVWELSVPQEFIDSVIQPPVKLTEEHHCLAPWCHGFKQPGTLVKTGTTVKQLKSGKKLLYYTICTGCGCEYALGEHGILQERTYFVRFYHGLLAHPSSTLQEVATNMGLSIDMLHRCIAFFTTRQHQCKDVFPTSWIDSNLLRKFVVAVKAGQTVKTIRRWKCWDSYQHFLVHRFHLEVMLAITNVVHPRAKRVFDLEDARTRVHRAVDEMLQANTEITIKSVSTIVGRSPETLRSWDCNQIIADGKRLQEQLRLKRYHEELVSKVTDYLIHHRGIRVQPNEVYEHLGRTRNSICRSDSTLTAEIGRKIRKHNEELAHWRSLHRVLST